MKKLILLLNMGGANSLDDVAVFLKNMFNDPCILGVKNPFLRKILANFITKLRLKPAQENYKKIGGKSPILDITDLLCKKLNLQATNEVKFDYAMNYTAPFVKDVLSKYKSINEIVVFPLYPHHSVTTITSSLNDFYKAYNELKLNAKVREIPEFYTSEIYNQFIINSIKSKISNANENEISLIFSAHSLPIKTIKNGDLYEKHVTQHVQILKNLLEKNGLKFKEIILAYQSRLGPVKWLEPNLSEILNNLDSKKALIYPLSFCIDNSETVFELAIEYAHIAKELEFEFYKVCECPNDSDDFVKFIQDKIRE
ncbi:ferrochelatase [Campylobacter mucosalis]|uniref:ferrochelatase n=1 Tax=Campylobacter mucosalis TaxID=202 RepID=UPI0014703766|nr:ferrochelatase [Campylobacter mucosalis]